ncbi:MAG: T9SS type A sorting domain-containing protein [Polaribacter sp.]|nr:T9SS type A sorting domain-containing protein [Polaribacter sp.]
MNNQISINLPNQFTKAKVEIYNMIGKLALQTEINSFDKKIDVSLLNNGIYMLKVSEGDKVGVQRLIKN